MNRLASGPMSRFLGERVGRSVDSQPEGISECEAWLGPHWDDDELKLRRFVK